MAMVSEGKTGVYHVLLVLPEDSEEAIVGTEEGAEREVICLEDDCEHCTFLAVSCIIAASQPREAEEAAVMIYGLPGVWTLATDISEYAGQLQEEGHIPHQLQPGVLFEGEYLFAVSDDAEVMKRAATFALEAILSPEDT